MSRFIITFACLTVVFAASAERYEFDRYQAIVDRQMFGPLPEGFDPSKPPSEVQKSAGGKSEKELTKEQEQVKKSVRFSMINLNPKGETMVGFTDSSNPKEVRHYYLKVGESRDGWTVKAADAVAATVSISKDGVDLDLELGAGSAGAPAVAGKAAGPAVGGLGGGLRRGGLLGGRAPGSGGMFSSAAGSLRERRMAKMQQREANEKAAAEDQAKRDAEAAAEKAKAEEEKAQREAEREQQRQQLMQIQEELKKAREARQAAEAAEKENADSSATSDE